ALDGERGGHHRVDVLLSASCVIYPVVADLGRVARGDLVDAELGSAHRPELAAEALHEDLGPLARVGGRGGESVELRLRELGRDVDRKSTRLNSSHRTISYAVFCLKKKKKNKKKT